MASSGNISSEAIFNILRILSVADRPLGVADLHRLTAEPTSSVHRAIATLEESHYASRFQGAARLVPGRMCSHLVRALVNRYALRTVARPYLMRLVELAGGPATINVRLGWYSVRIAALEGRAEYYEGRRIGETRLLHVEVAPLTILAFMREAERRNYAAFASARLGVPARDLQIPRLVREARCEDHLRRPHHARPGSTWISYPLFNPQGDVIAAISVSAPEPPGEALRHEIAATVASLQAELAADPAKCALPFARIDPDRIILPANASVD